MKEIKIDFSKFDPVEGIDAIFRSIAYSEIAFDLLEDEEKETIKQYNNLVNPQIAALEEIYQGDIPDEILEAVHTDGYEKIQGSKEAFLRLIHIGDELTSKEESQNTQ